MSQNLDTPLGDSGNPSDIQRKRIQSALTLRDKIMALFPAWCALEFLLANGSCSSHVYKELVSCRGFGVWEVCELPEGKQTLLSTLFVGGIGMGDTRRAWWRGDTGSSMGLTLRTCLLPCVPTGQCA
jgi:hypothetical protein